MKYRVSEVYSTIQGEGAKTGTPVVLLRLQGCAVGCPWCDTKYSWPERETRLEKLEWTPEELADLVLLKSEGHRWVLLTGGEPCEQAPLRPLIAELTSEGFRVMLETSGTALLDCPELVDHICVSPKADMPGGKALLPAMIQMAHELKCVIGKPEDLSKTERLVDENKLDPNIVSLQPLSGSDKATKLCIAAAQAHGWAVSIQTHKLLGLA